MQGESKRQKSMIVLMDPESLVPAEHPLREVRNRKFPCFARITELPAFVAVGYYGGVGTKGFANFNSHKILRALIVLRSLLSSVALAKADGEGGWSVKFPIPNS